MGKVRVGIARASAVAQIAEPLVSVASDSAISSLQKMIKQYDVGTIVVGLPRSLQGDETSQTAWVRQWVQQAKTQINLPFFWQDEALTSKIAEAQQLAHKKTNDVDSLAAAIILQDFLDTPEADRIVC